MSILVSIDPGTRHLGAALWGRGELNQVRSFHYDTASSLAGWVETAREVQHWVRTTPEKTICETPEIRSGWRKGDQNALLGLSGVAGAVAALLGSDEVEEVKPSVWTEQRTKPANHIRALKRLTDREIDQLANSLGHSVELLHELCEYGDLADDEHILDAVCVGLYGLGRWD